MNKKIGWVITYYQSSDEGLECLRDMINKISTENYYLVLSSHSIIPEDIQEKCDYVIYERSNIIDDRKYSHGVAENVLIRQSFEHLRFVGIEWAYKITYDSEIVDIHHFKDWIKDYKYDFVSCQWGEYFLATNSFFCNVNFLLDTFPVYKTIEEMFAKCNLLELCWVLTIKEKKLEHKIFTYPNKAEFFGDNKIDKVGYDYSGLQVSYNALENRYYISNESEAMFDGDIYIFDYFTDLEVYFLKNRVIPPKLTLWILPPINSELQNGFYVEFIPKNSKTKIIKNFNVKDFSLKHPLCNKFKRNKYKEHRKLQDFNALINFKIYEDVNLNDKLKNIKNYLDIGTNIGMASINFVVDPNCKIYMVEANPRNTSMLIEILGHYKNVKIIPNAVYDSMTSIDFYQCEDVSVVSSVFPIIDSQKTINTIKVPTITPDVLFENEIKENILDFMKIDIEGAEYMFFDSISDKNLCRIKQMIIEFHDNTNYKVLSIIEKLARNDFDYTWLPYYGYDTNVNMLDSNMGVIYAKNLRY
jgi:FkbM family methyltransferase